MAAVRQKAISSGKVLRREEGKKAESEGVQADEAMAVPAAVRVRYRVGESVTILELHGEPFEVCNAVRERMAPLVDASNPRLSICRYYGGGRPLSELLERKE